MEAMAPLLPAGPIPPLPPWTRLPRAVRIWGSCCLPWGHKAGPGRQPGPPLPWTLRPEQEGPQRLTRVSLGTAELTTCHRLKQKGSSLLKEQQLQKQEQ